MKGTQGKVLNLQTRCLSTLVSEEGIHVLGISKVNKTLGKLKRLRMITRKHLVGPRNSAAM